MKTRKEEENLSKKVFLIQSSLAELPERLHTNCYQLLTVTGSKICDPQQNVCKDYAAAQLF